MKSLLQAVGALVAVAIVSAVTALGIFKLEGDVLPEPPVPVTDEVVEVDAPREVVVGEMVRLVAEGKLVKWRCFPSNPDCEVYGEKGEKYAISFREPGQFLIIFAVYYRGNLEIKHVDIVVKAPDVVIPDPPDPDDPVIVPQPLTQNVLVWCNETNTDKVVCALLSKHFGLVAQEIKRGELTTPDEVISRTAELNSSLDLASAEAVLAKIQAYLINASDTGSLNSMSSHALVWAAISEGFKVYAER